MTESRARARRISRPPGSAFLRDYIRFYPIYESGYIRFYPMSESGCSCTQYNCANDELAGYHPMMVGYHPMGVKQQIADGQVTCVPFRLPFWRVRFTLKP